ncbi:uncharacterized protein [Littorina saxatilis]|uniref:uncharacterized protein isoform X2 n=1 Tax=Littorina saxatilis TaxID=31220 RepID=UPI0038B5AB5A
MLKSSYAQRLDRQAGRKQMFCERASMREEMECRSPMKHTFVVFLLLFSIVQMNGAEACNAIFTAVSGTFHSPNYPSEYNDNLDCYYNIQMPPGYRITLKFHYFKTESTHDFVQMFDGASGTAPLLGKFSGSKNPPDTRTTQNKMHILFHTDGSVSYAGFSCSYFASPDPVESSASDVSNNEVIIGGTLGGFAFVVTVALIIIVVLFVKRKENAVVEIRDEQADGVCCKPTPSDLPNPKAEGQRRLRDNRGGAAQNSKSTQEDVLPSQPAVQEPLFPCEGDYEGLCRTQADAGVNEYGMLPQPASSERAKYPKEDLYMNV